MNAIIFSAVWGVLMMFSGVFLKKNAARYLGLAGGLLLFMVSAAEMYTGHPFFMPAVKNLLQFNSLNHTFIALLSGLLLFFFLISGKDVQSSGSHSAEYFALIFFSVCGAFLCSTYNNLLLLFLGIEIMSIPMYILAGSDKPNLKSSEASLKYFLMGAFSTGILLMGLAFIFGGNPGAAFFLDKITINEATMPVLMATGLVLVLAGLSFKVSAAPFHFWTPDVYDGSPTVFTSFMSTIVKAAGFFAFIRLFSGIFSLHQDQWQMLVVCLVVATLLIGNISAVFQQSVKRMLAYSSIAQAGFMMLSLLALNGRAEEGIILYSAAYSLATIGLFSILLRMQDYTIEGFNGFAQKQPLAAFAATVFLLSLTGIPLTAGFQAKFWLLLAVLEKGGMNWVAVIAVCFAAISAYYYFRVIQAMYFRPVADETAVHHSFSPGYSLMLIIFVLIILALGINPELLTGWIYR